MKFKVSSSVLLKQLSSISGVLSSASNLPIVECFLFELNNKELKITATDLETTIIASLEVDSTDTGNICIPAKILLETLKAFPSHPLTFDINEKKSLIELSSEYGKYKLVGFDSGDFPQTITIEKPASFDIMGSTLNTALNKVLFAVGNDDLRPVMQGVFIKINADGLTFVATDAHKLSKYQIADIKAKSESSYIIPKKPFSLVKSICSGEKIQIKYNPTNVSFTFDNIHLITRLIDGKYPNYDAVIPKKNEKVLTLSRTEFLNSIKRVSVYSNKQTNMIKLNIKEGKLNVMAEDLNMSNEATENLKCEYKGSDIEIGFNSRFLLDILGSLEDEEVNIQMSEPSKPGIIVPVKSKEDVLMLVMPVLINN